MAKSSYGQSSLQLHHKIGKFFLKKKTLQWTHSCTLVFFLKKIIDEILPHNEIKNVQIKWFQRFSIARYLYLVFSV
jgi:hypothetical protein